MPETPEVIRNLADTMVTRFTPPSFVPGCEVQSIADVNEYTTDNGWIEAIVGGDNQQRVRYYGTPQGVGVGDFVDVEYFPAYKLYRVFGSTLGGTAVAGGVRVNRVWDEDFDAPALIADADGNIGIRTNAPNARLEVEDDGTSNNIILKVTADNQSPTALVIGNDTYSTTDLEGLGFWVDNAGVGNIRMGVANGPIALQPTGGNVGIGTLGPDAKLDVLDNSGAQLRLTFEDGVKFANLTVDTSHDLTIKPSSTGQIILQPTTDSADFFQVLDADGGTPILNVDSTNERVGIGTDEPGKLLEVSTGASVPGATIRVAGGSATSVGELISGLELYNADLSVDTYHFGASFKLINTDVTFGRYSRLGIFTGNAETTEVERITILNTGNVGIGITSPLAKTHIDQASTTAAIPVLYLDQADISEEMIEFNTTIGTGNAIEAVGAKTLTVTHFIKCTLPGGLTRYWPVGTIA